MRNRLRKAGFNVAVIYGALDPDVRREQAQLFRSGKADVLVATDAIGMGLNLPIRRVVFSTAVKWDGQKERLLSASEVQQIAGRAGRYGYHESGRVAGTSHFIRKHLASMLNTSIDDLSPPYLFSPDPALISLAAEQLNTNNLPELLRLLQIVVDATSGYTAGKMTDMRALAARTQTLPLPLEDRFRLCLAPVNSKGPLFDAWWSYAKHIANQHSALPPAITPFLQGKASSLEQLQQAETLARILDLYLWLAQRWPDYFDDTVEARNRLDTINRYIHVSLHSSSLHRTCPECGRRLPENYSHRLCNDCWAGEWQREYY